MFEIGDYVVYGETGVCRVESVGKLDSCVAQRDKIYYTLSPQYMKESTIFTPVNNQKVRMRAVMTREEALELIDHMKVISTLCIQDERHRETEYKEILRNCESEEIVKLIKTIYERNRKRNVDGKKITVSDDRYFKRAEDTLYGELAVSLSMDKEEVKAFVIERIAG